MNVLIVIDMQNDFIDGALGTKEAEKIVPSVVKKMKDFNGRILCTRDTHEDHYLKTQEGKMLPVKHCIRGTKGWELHDDIGVLPNDMILDKPSFGSAQLGEVLCQWNREEPISSITLVGLCTDICVISNGMIVKAFLPEVLVTVDASCCAGVTPESHERALKAMEACQIQVLR